jgi:hypothetical protein
MPPSPEEQRRLDENRKRRDAQSQRMSQLLLTGWKMLGPCAAVLAPTVFPCCGCAVRVD